MRCKIGTTQGQCDAGLASHRGLRLTACANDVVHLLLVVVRWPPRARSDGAAWLAILDLFEAEHLPLSALSCMLLCSAQDCIS